MNMNEDIELFLSRLKLSEKYLELFRNNGYLSVKDCIGLTEDDLKELGVTLPGHYRRILSKLPKKEDVKDSANNNPRKLIPVLSSPMLIDEPEEVYDVLSPQNIANETNLIETNETISHEISEIKVKPTKPPRSSRLSNTTPPLSFTAVTEDVYEVQNENAINLISLNDGIVQDKSPSSINSSSPFKNIVNAFDFSMNDITPSSQSNDISEQTSDEDEEDELPLPVSWDNEKKSLPPPSAETDEYDTLNINRNNTRKKSSEIDDGDNGYGILSISSSSPTHSGSIKNSLEQSLSVSEQVIATPSGNLNCKRQASEYEEVVFTEKDDSKRRPHSVNNDEVMSPSPPSPPSVIEYSGTLNPTEHLLDKEKKWSLSSSVENLSSNEEDNIDDEPVYEECKEDTSKNTNEDVYEDADDFKIGAGKINKLQSKVKRSPHVTKRRERLSNYTPEKSPETSDSDGNQDDYAEIGEFKNVANEGSSGSIKKPSVIVRRRGSPMMQRPISVFVNNSSTELLPNDQPDRNRTFSATLDRQSFKSRQNNKELSTIGVKRPTITSPISPQTKKKTKEGWLMKHGGHEGRAPLRKRWVVFNGDELIYYENETKLDVSKGVIPVEVMVRVQPIPNDSNTFNVLVKGGRKYIFQAESSDDRNMWTSTLMAGIMIFEKQGYQFKPGGIMCMPYKEGTLKLEGSRAKVYVTVKGEFMAYYKNRNEFTVAQPISRLEMKLATVKDCDKKKFQVIFPFKTFIFTAESELEKSNWIEALQDAVSEGLSDYKILNQVWKNKSNTKCADCGRENPDWASINLAIVICKHCAGVHRELGVHNSKVRSLKMDQKVWTSGMVQLLQDIGNKEANFFWCSNLNKGDAINDMADKQQRNWFINAKYVDMSYAQRYDSQQTVLNMALVESIRDDDTLKVYSLIFNGADPNCNTGKEYAKTPYLFACHLKRTTVSELLHQNGGTEEQSPDGHIPERITSIQRSYSTHKSKKPPVCLRDVLYKYGGDFKSTQDSDKNIPVKKLMARPREFQKRLCILENQELKYCDPDKVYVVKDQFSCKEFVSIGVVNPEIAVKAGFKHCFEVARQSGRTYLFCTEKEDTLIKWTRGLMQAIFPPYVQDKLDVEEDYSRVGKLNMKSQNWVKHDAEWSQTWCRLQGKQIHYYHNEAKSLETIDLRKVVQITIDQTSDSSATTLNKEVIPIIMLVFKEKTFYFQALTKADGDSWLSYIRKADCESGPTLENQQLTPEGVPILLEKCITFVEQFGLKSRGIYRLSGTHSKTTQLLSNFRQNARETQMKEGDLNVHDVANALKRWFKALPGSLFTEHLHKEWIDTAQMKADNQHNQKMEWYKHLLDKLPEINRVTLKVMLMHLKNVADPENENDMSMHNLAIVFGPTLMEPASQSESDNNNNFGDTSQEISCVEDLLQYYDWLFDVTESDRDKERLMQEAKEKISMASQQQSMLTTLDYEMMVPIYIQHKDEKCVNYKVNLTAMELVYKICTQHGYPKDKWGLFEVILNGDAERPIHYSEHVLTVIKSWQMPSTNYLLVKNDYIRDKMRWFKKSLPDDINVLMEGPLKTYNASKKKWVKVMASVVRLLDGSYQFKYLKSQDSNPIISSGSISGSTWRKKSIRSHVLSKSNIPWLSHNPDGKLPTTHDLSMTKVYIGVDKKTKLPANGKIGFTILPVNSPSQSFSAETEGEMYRWHNEGFTPPISQDSTPNNMSPATSLPSSKSNSLRRNFFPVSQQELGAAVVKAVTLQRTSSNESSESARELYQFAHSNSMQSNTSQHLSNDIFEESEEQVYDVATDMNIRDRVTSTASERSLSILQSPTTSRHSSHSETRHDEEHYRRRISTYHDDLRLYGDRCVAVLTQKIRTPGSSPIRDRSVSKPPPKPPRNNKTPSPRRGTHPFTNI